MLTGHYLHNLGNWIAFNFSRTQIDQRIFFVVGLFPERTQGHDSILHNLLSAKIKNQECFIYEKPIDISFLFNHVLYSSLTKTINCY